MTFAPRPNQLFQLSRLARIVLLVGMGVLCGLLVSGCGGDEDGGGDGPALSEVENFDAYPLYYAGDEIAGNELDDITGADGRQRNVSFFYGTCDPAADGPLGEGGCAPPAEIQVSSICDRHPALYGGGAELFDLRGAKASMSGGGLEIFTGRTTVVIFGERELMRPAIRQLRPVGQDTPASRLPPPVPGALRGGLPCQHSPR